MDHGQPSRTDMLRCSLSGEFLPERGLVHAAFGGAAPLDRRGSLDQGTITLFGKAMGLLDPPPLVDVAERADAAERASRAIEIDFAGRRHPAFDAVIGAADAELGLVCSVLARSIGP